MAHKDHIIVLGAGVTGLTSAIFLAEAGYIVTIVAAHVPGDSSIEYTSPWAGAHWRTSASPAEARECDWDLQTYDYWLDVLERERKDARLPKCGIKMYDSWEYWDGAVNEELWWAPHVKDFRGLSPLQAPWAELNARMKGGTEVQWACAFTAMCLNVPQYLLYLQEKAKTLGVKIIKTRLPVDAGLEIGLEAAESEAGTKATCFVNATGLGAAKLCGDTAMFPVRGQTVLVKGEAHATINRRGADYGAYVIPRPGSAMTILGGVREKGNWSEDVDPKTTQKILHHCSFLAPELLTGEDGGFEVVSVQCGLRPGREGGPRMEKEVVGARRVVHAYGHGGAGYQNSVGSARLVVKSVQESSEAVQTRARL